MRVIDPGHTYMLQAYDGRGEFTLTFMKREGEDYPGNVGSYPGTNCQEVLRAMIDRVLYLDKQIPAPENIVILNSLRSALVAFELRAARRHGRELDIFSSPEVDRPCETCGHVNCGGH